MSRILNRIKRAFLAACATFRDILIEEELWPKAGLRAWWKEWVRRNIVDESPDEWN